MPVIIVRSECPNWVYPNMRLDCVLCARKKAYVFMDWSYGYCHDCYYYKFVRCELCRAPYPEILERDSWGCPKRYCLKCHTYKDTWNLWA